ncbi:hypothetical protein ACFWV1_13015 [Streptomyces sp. NPDC058700]|uniref:hypothetical protein n=1 Tax=Streptomyces sp. NPDC058700 TaxID=3346607 RepID=UPI0036509172
MTIPIIGMIITLVALGYILWSGHRTRAMLQEAQALRAQARALDARRQQYRPQRRPTRR